MRNGILKSMGMDETPAAPDYQIGFAFQVTFEPNKETIARLRAEQEVRVAAGETHPQTIHLEDSELDCVVYGTYLGQRVGGVMLAGGMIPQATIRGPEISRIPKLELFGRIDQAFSGAKG